MKKWFMIAVSALLALLVISNVYLLVRVGKLEKSIAPDGAAGNLVGTWDAAKEYGSLGRAVLTIKPDGTFEKVFRVKYEDGVEYIRFYQKGYLDGDTLIYTEYFSPPFDQNGNVERMTEVDSLQLKESREFSTISRHGSGAIQEDYPDGSFTQYFKHK